MALGNGLRSRPQHRGTHCFPLPRGSWCIRISVRAYIRFFRKCNAIGIAIDISVDRARELSARFELEFEHGWRVGLFLCAFLLLVVVVGLDLVFFGALYAHLCELG